VSDRVTARHRAPRRASTPLTTTFTTIGGFSTAVAPRVEALGRGGAVIAVSSGLVATMGLPAQAVPFPADPPGQTSGIPLSAAADVLGAGQTPNTQIPNTQILNTQILNLSEPVTGDPVAVDGSLAVASGVQTDAVPALTASATARLSFEVGTMTATTTTHPDRSAGVATPARTTAGRGVSTHTSRSTARTATSSGSSGAAHSTTKAAPAKAARGASVSGSAVLALAARYVGIPYRKGGTTPAGFDCSAYVQYVYRLLGVSLPRTTDQQLAAVTRISRSQALPGDLVFFMSGRGSYHMGIYAGGGMMYDSPRTGARISKRAIFSSNVVFGRV
jgi:peptidoglycan DL-endopeptidase CwlO